MNLLHHYRSILPKDVVKKLTNESEHPNEIVILQHYERFLNENEYDESKVTWAMAEAAWLLNDATPITFSVADARALKLAVADFTKELPPLVSQCGVYCYEFPIHPEVYLHGDVLTAILISNSGGKGDISVVMEFSDSETMAHVFSPEEITEGANRALSFPKDMKSENITPEQELLVNYRQRMLIAYHLCNGHQSWREFREQQFPHIEEERPLEDDLLGEEEDDPQDWWKK